MIRKLLKIVGILVLLLAIGIGAMLFHVKNNLPNVGDPQEVSIDYTADRVERGEYLANHVYVCMDCHTTRQIDVFSMPPHEEKLGSGGFEFSREMNFPGNYVSANLTPHETGIGNWTDTELFHAITTGVGQDGRALFPIMPYPNYAKADKEDIYDIIAYLRSLKPIENEVKKSESDFPMSLIINTIPAQAANQPKPSKSDELAYGKYLVNVSSCYDCHTNMDDKGNFIGDDLAGGMEFPLPFGTVRSSNITPHKEFGIGNWTEEAFVSRFTAHVDSGYVPPKVQQGQLQTVMPWMMYGGMEEDDLSAIYAYLMSVKASDNKVERFTASK